MMALRPTTYPIPLIGWKEEVHLPELGGARVLAKIDTGARTSALHADAIDISGKRVTFKLGTRWHEMRLVDVKRIKSSNGFSEIRPVVETVVELGAHRFFTSITLTDRRDMGVPMLLGREAIRGHFLVQPARSFLLRPKKARP
jgi:hypothetical protein